MNQSIHLRLLLAKTLLIRAREQLANRNDDIALSMAVIHIHDSLDNFLGAIISHRGIVVPRGKDSLIQLYHHILNNGSITAFVNIQEIGQLNTIRNAIKHDGVMGNPTQIKAIFPVIINFINDVSIEVFDTTVENIHISSLITKSERKDALEKIEKNIEAEEYESAIKNAGIGLFQYFDSNQWRFNSFGLIVSGKIPKDEKIVFPQGDLDKAHMQLVEFGIDPYLYHRFKNLTPEVGFDNLQDRNIIIRRNDLLWHEKNWTKENALFCLNFLSTLLLKQQRGYGGYTIVQQSNVDTVTFKKDSAIYTERTDGKGFVKTKDVKKDDEITGTVDGYVNGAWEEYDDKYNEDYASMSVGFVNGKVDYLNFWFKKSDIKITQNPTYRTLDY